MTSKHAASVQDPASPGARSRWMAQGPPGCRVDPRTGYLSWTPHTMETLGPVRVVLARGYIERARLWLRGYR